MHTWYRAIAGRLVHFTIKITHSKAPACGVRVSAAAALDLPLVGVRTLLADGVIIPLDHAKKLPGVPQVARQIWDAESGHEAPPPAAPPQILGLMRAVRETAHEEGTGSVSVRARQVLLPIGADAAQTDAYLAITPLASTGFSVVLRQKLDALAHQKGRKKTWFGKGFLGFGGGDSRNVGTFAAAARTPLVFLAPSPRWREPPEPAPPEREPPRD